MKKIKNKCGLNFYLGYNIVDKIYLNDEIRLFYV